MAVGVVSEFNPFHNGHRYLVEQIKNQVNEPVVAIMSGSFVQRGEVVLQSKFERAESALNNGVDLVIELPTVYAVANAQRFAGAGVGIAKAFADINYLAFGCETDDIALLKTASSAIDDKTVGELVTQNMRCGVSYPTALAQAVEQVFGREVAEVISTPNNILAVEYLRAMAGTGLAPLPIKRIGAEHDSTLAVSSIASASLIRQELRAGREAYRYLPTAPKSITHPENLERAMLYRLRTMTAEDFAQLPDVGEGLENRIFDAVQKYNSFEEIIMSVKTKRYTLARLRRIFTCALLSVTEELQSSCALYARVLGFSPKGAEILKGCELDVVTSVAKAIKNGGATARLLQIDVRATDIFALATDKITNCGTDYTAKIIKKS